ncbi:unnamed protein product [Callosobruchus maculatus]|uniref:Uncharacterized protein n=1 Tax=Callosobruchus maculatus TaxID=64391 RepID=A0A653CTE1_CALMS|nr:unnamed protein product [Callosobruchus maculatus]
MHICVDTCFPKHDMIPQYCLKCNEIYHISLLYLTTVKLDPLYKVADT